MTNKEWICGLPLKDFAALLIQTRDEDDYDESMDGDWEICGTRTSYLTSNGKTHGCYEDALQHEMKWLKRKHNSKRGKNGRF